MAPDRMLEMVGQEGGPLAGASLWRLAVVEIGPLGPAMQRMVLTGPGLEGLTFLAGQDLMFRIPVTTGKVTNRRYTIRAFDVTIPAVTVDVSLHGAGPGTDWVRAATIGGQIEAIGPRGKITPRAEADWHLFIGDETGLPGVLAMIEALPPTSTVQALLEIDTPDDEQAPESREGQEAQLRWLHRLGQSEPGDSSLLQGGLTEMALPDGVGHVYVAAEAGVVRNLRRDLLERGLRQEQISAKAYWRRGLPNAEHGEPLRQDD